MFTSKTIDGAAAYVPPHNEGDAAAKLQAEYLAPGRHQTTELSSSNCIVEFAKTSVNAAIVDPVRAVAQIIDNTSRTGYDKQLQVVANSFGLSLSAPAEFGTTQYFGQQLGNAVGMMVPFMLIRGAGGKIASSVSERCALTESAEALKQTPKVLDIAAKEAFASGVTGLTYGTFLRTSEDPSPKAGFWEKRFHQGAADMATFGTLGFVSPFVGKSLNSVASSIERSASSDAASIAGNQYNSAMPIVTRMTAESLRSPIISGAISAVPAGLLNAEMQAAHDGRWVPTAKELKENLVNMAFIGGAFGGAHSLYRHAATNEALGAETVLKQTNTKDITAETPAGYSTGATSENEINSNPHQTPESSETVSRTFESSEAASQHFRTLINEGNWKQARELIDHGALDPTILNSEAIVGAIRAGFDSAVAKENWRDVCETLKFGVVPPEHAATPANKEIALKNLATYVGEKSEKHVAWVLESNILSESDLRHSANLRRITQIGLQNSFGGPEDAMKRFDGYSWVDYQLRSDSAKEQIAADIRTHNYAGVQKLIQRVQDMSLVSASEITEIGRQVLPARIETANLLETDRFGKHFFGDHWAQEPSLRTAAKVRIHADLAKGNTNSSEALLYHKLVSGEFFHSEETKKLAQGGFKKTLEDVYPPKEIAERYQELSNYIGELSAEDMKATAVEGLRKYFYSSKELQQYIDMARDTLKIDFTHEDLQNSARKVLTESLSNWHTHQVEDVLNLKILNPEDVKNAAADAIPRSIEGNHAITTHLQRQYELDESRITAALHKHAAEGKITNVLRTALLRGSDLNSALNDYAGISTLTNETGRALYERLKKEDPVWSDRNNIANSFELGVTEFGEARMLRFALNARVNPHDTLLDFDRVVSMYKRSGMTPESFEGKVLSQVSRDAGVDEAGSAYAQLQAIAKSFPDNPDEILTRARASVPELKALADSVSDTKYGVFADWNTLKRFGKLQHLLEQQETLDMLDDLTKNGQGHLASWLKTLMFHPDSRIPLAPVMQFWKEPGKFLALDDNNSGTAHGLKKPSNYTDIPNLDLTPVQLRDALLDGSLDKLQVFNPMRIEYDLAPNLDINKEFDLALGARREGRQGTAKNSQKLFSEVNRVLKSDAPEYTIKDLVSGKDPPTTIREKLMDLLYNTDIGVPKPQANMRLIAELHRKSDPVAVLAGDDTVSCMGFGTGKNNIYMFNPNDVQFTVRIVNQEGKVRTFAQSVLTKDKDVKENVPNIIAAVQNNNKSRVHEILSNDALRTEKSILAADNVEVHPKYYGIDHQMALDAVYTDFFNRYLQQFGESQNLRTDKIVIGLGYTDAMKGLPKEPNTFVPQAPLAYSDKTHDTVYRLEMDRKPLWTATPTKIEIPEKPALRKEVPSSIEGIAPLTFEDTLPVAWLESKAYQDNPSMIEGLHNMENSLIAQAINNTAKERPNMSLKYSSPDGTTQGYLVAYEGKYGNDEKQQPVIFVSDYSTDRSIGDNGLPRAGRAGGKLLQGFMEVYKREYLDKGEMIPVLANAREETSYKLLLDNLKVISKRTGYQFEMQEVGTHQSGTSVLHDLLIVPRTTAPGS